LINLLLWNKYYEPKSSVYWELHKSILF
jgi:hypothetical protein